VLTNCNSDTLPHGNELIAEDRCISDILHDGGYSLGYIGKLHLYCPREENYPYTEGRRGNGVAWDAYTPPGPLRHGFDFWHSYGCCDWHFDPHYWVGDARVDERIEPKKWSVEHEADVAVDYIRNADGRHRDPDKPFALFVAHNPPHMPFHEVPERYVAQYDGKTAADLLTRPNVRLEGTAEQAAKHVKNYFAAVTGIDEQFGRILQALDDEGLTENTIVVFSSDHGEMMGSQGRMHKDVWYDESLLMPFIIRWPAAIRSGRDDLLLSVPDILPTLLGLMGLGDAAPDDVQGTDYSGALLGREVERPTSALYLNCNYSDPAGGLRGLRTHRYTFVADRNGEGERLLLYDNVTDRYQMTNIAPDRPDVVASLRAEMAGWLRRTGDPWRE
jgi:N-acetylglucosamine-6-sulfatase